MSTYKLNGRDYLSLSGNTLHYFEITGRESSGGTSTTESFSDWHENALDIEDFKVIPFGKSNDIPQQIQEAVLPNSLAHRLQKRKAELLIEQGPYLYTQEIDGTQYFRRPVHDQNIIDWLESIGYEEILINNAIDYYFQNSVTVKIFRERAGRLVNNSQSANIEHISSYDCRLAYKKTDKNKIPTHIIVGDWVKQDKKELRVYPIYDSSNPSKYPVSIHYAKFGTYGIKNYPLPDIYGSLEWMKNSTNTPKIFSAFTKNSLNIKWHIQSPAKFWEDKRAIIKQNCAAAVPPIDYKESMLEELKGEILDKISQLLSGVENVGKFWHNEYVVELIGANAMEHGWKITPIEQKTKEYVESQIKIYETAAFAVQAGLGLHAALANVGADGKSDSGSEQYYAWAIHQKTATPLPEYYVCKALNDVIKTKFGTNIKIGFYRTTPERQQDITNSQRLIPTN
ncbi:hypothetical protein [Abyssalbus ytuae]|uniref:Uncharacterized protein n=1 Tax=Abyssalbus ytuae TaxID=2926907 RepID=A0A9E6ZL32_9FLAO|nr:hypothetical protein [Abyssalbus ytuae]UOB16579.1 hypothetical protein MQE35_12640 [Abyssalbus ytuae]